MIAIVRLRSEIGTSREVRDTFKLLKLKKVYSAVIVEETPITKGMIKRINDFVAWGEASSETQAVIGKGRGLKPPRGGLKSKKMHYPRGNLGNNGDKINDLVRKMM